MFMFKKVFIPLELDEISNSVDGFVKVVLTVTIPTNYCINTVLNPFLFTTARIRQRYIETIFFIQRLIISHATVCARC